MSILRYRLTQRLSAVANLTPRTADQLASEVLDIFGQTVDEFIVHRHAELQREGYPTEAIYQQIRGELEEWRFSTPPLSLRQIRRRIYG